MRINVYAEELTDEVQLVTKTVTDEKFGERVFYGLRTFLISPDELHSDPADDDRSAITFWIPWTRKGGHQPGVVAQMIEQLARTLDAATTAMLGRGDMVTWGSPLLQGPDGQGIMLPCYCGEPDTEGSVHRTDGPCYTVQDTILGPVTTPMPTRTVPGDDELMTAEERREFLANRDNWS